MTIIASPVPQLLISSFRGVEKRDVSTNDNLILKKDFNE